MRYFFHTEDSYDEVGVELPTIAKARNEAAAYLCGLMKDDDTILGDGLDFEVKVTDDKGLSLFTLVAICINSPNVSRDGPSL